MLTSILRCRHTIRFILCYTFFMPMVLWKNLRWGVFFVAPLITVLLAGIDNIGNFIENPINILPMLSYCRVIHDNIILAAHDWSLDNAQVWHTAQFHHLCSTIAIQSVLFRPY
jgi:predicted membrane chloride channel (bestrophin family)